jgi:hypothetical protein
MIHPTMSLGMEMFWVRRFGSFMLIGASLCLLSGVGPGEAAEILALLARLSPPNGPPPNPVATLVLLIPPVGPVTV